MFAYICLSPDEEMRTLMLHMMIIYRSEFVSRGCGSSEKQSKKDGYFLNCSFNKCVNYLLALNAMGNFWDTCNTNTASFERICFPIALGKQTCNYRGNLFVSTYSWFVLDRSYQKLCDVSGCCSPVHDPDFRT